MATALQDERDSMIELEGEDLEVTRPSKVLRKRAMEELKKFGYELVTLPPGRLARLDLPPHVAAAVTEARRISAHGARKRQIQGIAKLLEDVDVPALKSYLLTMDRLPVAALTKQDPENPTSADGMSLVESLLKGGDAAVFNLGERYSHDSLQHLRQAVRRAQRQMAVDGQLSAATMTVAQCLDGLS